MPKPILQPCGGPGQPACPPTPAASIKPGESILYEGEEYIVGEEDEQGEDEDE